MAVAPLNRMIRQIRGAVALDDTAELTEAELLERYVRERNDAAFETLVRRHGPMVLGVCQRILRDDHAAEDAFQATFLILVRRAAALRSPAAIANWLHGVARHPAAVHSGHGIVSQLGDRGRARKPGWHRDDQADPGDGRASECAAVVAERAG